MKPQEMPDHYIVGHRVVVGTNHQPVAFGWKENGRRRDSVLNPGDFCLRTHGDANAPRWRQPFEFVSFALEPELVSKVIGDDPQTEHIEFEMKQCGTDSIITRYAAAFRSELAAENPNGSLYADMLTVSFTLHLLSNYAVAKPRIPAPRGKLNSFQLRAVMDFALSHLEDEVPLVALAKEANVSPFHFARLFRATVGMPPHQFILRQRIQKSLNLLKIGRLPLAQIALASGFHDQAHFTKAFRKILGTTPAMYSIGN
jgi:AraC family transcriptional regulator